MGAIEVLPVTVGSKLMQARNAKGLTREQLSKLTKLKITTKQIENWEKDRSEPNLSNLKLICGHLGVPFQDIMDEVAGDAPEHLSDPLAQARKHLTAAAAALGGRVIFSPPAEQELEEEAEDSVLGLPEVRAIIEAMATTAGIKSRTLPHLITVAEEVGNTLDPEPLRALAEALGYPVLGCPELDGDEGEVSLDKATVDKATDRGFASLVVQALYPGFKDFDRNTLEALRTRIEALYGEAFSEAIAGKGWFEADDDYQARLQRDLMPLLVRALKDRKPVILPLSSRPKRRMI